MTTNRRAAQLTVRIMLCLFGVVLVAMNYAAVRPMEKISAVHQEQNKPEATQEESRSVLDRLDSLLLEEKKNVVRSVLVDTVTTEREHDHKEATFEIYAEAPISTEKIDAHTADFADPSTKLQSIRTRTIPPVATATSNADITAQPNVIHTKDGNRVLDPSKLNIKINYPVFVASLYKSGTTTIHAYFECGGQKTVHYASGRKRTGPCLQRRITKGLKPVFQGCGGETFDIYTDNANLGAPRHCFDPSVHGLDAIYDSYPNGTILMSVRDSQGWLDSVKRYRFGKWSLFGDLKKCPDLWTTQVQDIGNRTLTEEDILHFYDWHTEHVRNFAKNHPSMTYIEVALEDDETGQILEDAIGIPAQCWGHANVNTRIVSTLGASHVENSTAVD